ncbi:MAG TPA: LysR family transcriptional regulator [Thauera sp.]|uniref:LysR family transcriptional regulator n=1 Tax=Thauera sp. TaxID=1905334 RepID=UPI002B95A259|nr:LysR family transcriptional regulator [Thauera sp.]HRP23598.1 LysR family transcriptional regulator [Thauera sp.]HRP67237.1 LysR family transcriptional regulator [Thauera sp.]
MDRIAAMRLFTRIVELGSFSRAAEQLGVARASATQIIKQLEARVGVRLLLRTTRQVTPTVDGSAYYQRCLAILGDLDELDAEFSQVGRHPQGSIRLDMSGSLCRLVLLPALPAFCARYPLIKLEIGVGDRRIDLVREGVDCVLRIGDLHDIPLVARELTRLDQVTCASADYLARHGVPRSLGELDRHLTVDYVSATTGKQVPLEFDVGGRLERHTLPAIVTVNNGDAYVAACKAGFGIIQLPRYHVSAELERGEFEEILAEHRPPCLPLHVLYPPNRQLSARLRALIDWLGELFASNPLTARR